jgi:hypothetical protein
MSDYEPVDLSALCDAGQEILGAQPPAAVGRQTFQGLPFLIGNPAGDDSRCFLGFGAGLRSDPQRIPLARRAHRVVVAHRLLDSDLEEGGIPGKQVADYVFHLAGGEALRVPVRERFEIASIPPDLANGFPVLPDLPYGAVSDARQTLYPRYEGRWSEAGRRQKEVAWVRPQSYFLWVWANPRPDEVIIALEIVPRGPRFIVAAVTLSQRDEHPFVRGGPRELRIVLPAAADAAKPFALEVEVDRGVATYPYPLPEQSAAEYLGAAIRGWGEAPNARSSPAYVTVAATPSATLVVRQDGEPLGSVRWEELESRAVVEPTPRLRLDLVDRGRNWVHTRILDDETGRPVPCRVHFRSPEGIPYQPHGHHGHLTSNNGTWHYDIGGDVRLGHTTYAYVDGTCHGWLPRGDVLVDVARGYEYEPLRARVRIEPGQRELTLRLRRWCDMAAERWFSGDTHVHFLSAQGSHTEAQGEDLNVVNLLQAQWGHLFTGSEEFTGRPSVSPDGRSIVYVTQENRQHFLGHLTLLGLRQPIMPWGSDGPNEAELGGTLEVTLSDWADQCHAQGGTVIIPHHPMPNGEQAALIATGRTDAVEMLWHSRFSHLEYYRYLNGGYRLPLVGGTDKMTAEVPVGLYRTYVYIPPDEEFSYASWCRNLALGRTFLSGGPLLRFSVEGRQIGDTLVLPAGGGTVEVEATAESIFPIHTLEIVQQGRVVAASEARGGARRLELRAEVRVTDATWLAARAGGPGYWDVVAHHDAAQRGIFAHSSPIYVACGDDWRLGSAEVARYMLTLVDGMLTYVRDGASQYPAETVTHHHGEADHLAYLQRPFLEAREAIRARLRDLGLER